MQGLIIAMLFSGALFYVARLFYKNFSDKTNECGGNCGCSKVDIKKIEQEIVKGKEIR